MVGARPMNAGFKIPTRIETEPAKRGFDLLEHLNFIWRRWMFIGAVIALAVIVGIISLMRATPLYTAGTQVLLEREKGPSLANSELQMMEGIAFLENQVAILKSDSLLRRVVVKERLAAQDTSRDTPEENAKTTEAIQRAINQLRNAVVVKRSGQSNVLDISITWTDPVKAGQL